MKKRGFTLIELLVVIAIIAILASILFPVFAKAREKARQATCNSNIRQLAVAIQMYSQDNGSQYPGIDGTTWASKIAPYLGSSDKMFQCPSDNSGDSGKNSYALAGMLVRETGLGAKESQVVSPSEVGAICDASPSESYPTGRLVGGGGSQAVETMSATIEPRHSKGAIVGFCDGHAKYFQGAINLNDDANGAVRAMYHVASLGLVDNPGGMWPSSAGITGLSGTVTVGGEYATYPIVMAAAKVYGSYYTAGFKGYNFRVGRPSAGWVWGWTSGSGGPATTAVAFDAFVFIVAKGCKIPGIQPNGFNMPSLNNNAYALNTTNIGTLFRAGYQKDTVQVYEMPATTLTHAFKAAILGQTTNGVDSLEVANDAEMVEKVANDPWGVGYCSSAFFDPDRVVAIAPIIGTTTYYWPRQSAKFRWTMAAYGETQWPWKRSIDVDADAGALGAGIQNAIRGLGGNAGFKNNGLNPGPLFTWGYWPGQY